MNQNSRSFKEDTVALLLLVGSVIWFGHEMLWADKVPFYRDLGPYFYPMRFSLAQSFKSGELPLWDRHMAMGFPLLANFQSGVFYPPHLLYLVLPFFDAARAAFLFHYLVAAIGSYRLCRYWGYPPYLAIVGAMLFAFGGTVVSLINLLNHFQTAVWLPWAVLLWERSLRFGSRRDFLSFTLVLLLQFLAGSPEIYLLTMGVLVLDILRIRTPETNVGYLRTSFFLAGANTLVLGLSMVQVLPTVELLLESRGGKPISYIESALWSFHPLDLINLFFLDKEVNTSLGSGIRLFFLRDIPFLVSYYMGAISLFGISLWLFSNWRREKGFILGLLIISLIVAAGGYTPVYRLLFQYLPFFSLFRYPEKFFFLTYLLLIFIALKGLSAFLACRTLSRTHFLAFFLVFSLWFFPYLWFRLDTAILSRFIAQTTSTPLLAIDTLGRTASVLVNLERQVALGLAILLLLWAWKKGILRPALSQALMVGLVFIDLVSAHKPYQYLTNPAFVYESPKVIRDLNPEPNRLFYYPGLAYLHPNYYSILRQPSFPELHSIVFSNLVPNTGVFHGFDYMQELDALRRWPYLAFLTAANKMPWDQLYRLLGALNVKYIVSFRELSGGGITLVHHFPEHPSWLYRLDRFVPRASVVARATQEKDPVKVLKRLSSEEFDPMREVFLEEPLPLPAQDDFRAQAKILSYTNHKVTIRASLNGPGVLVLADSFYPGWRAYVNGKEEKILRANVFFRAVPLTAGEHLIEFRYEPRSFAIGLAVSLMFLAAIAIWSTYLFVPRK